MDADADPKADLGFTVLVVSVFGTKYRDRRGAFRILQSRRGGTATLGVWKNDDALTECDVRSAGMAGHLTGGT